MVHRSVTIKNVANLSFEPSAVFSSDVLETIERCIYENVAPDDLKMEINSSK